MAWNLHETSIRLPYSYESIVELLKLVIRSENVFSHYDFAQWCDNFTMVIEEVELPPLEESAVLVARDIECQWDLFLVNSYSFKELQNLELSEVKLPSEWFVQWLDEF